MVYWIDYGFSTAAGGRVTSYTWRIPTILQCVFLIPMIFILWIIPETPRWLVAHDRHEEALAVLRRLYAKKLGEEEIKAAHKAIVETVAIEESVGSGSWKDLLHNDGTIIRSSSRYLDLIVFAEIQSQRRLLIACAIQAFQQLGGINALICKIQS